ncbi:PREDICTED: mitochondrial distribution and morphology protein 34 [Drosophila arizonae]|uniref:Mitochondrial distribution and morphology protein 34 n=1 Tax=Drosophila arizonae TaxID=7263 RepID=A0ABM1NXT5_DROAR|nr:PREDICTED: mitochondrial distribution and morphology protein 34 [Drosophila arizonae]
MLTKQPDYTISELGYPLLQEQLCPDKCDKKPRLPEPCFRHSPSLTPGRSPSRLLPLRETLDDYNKRLLSEQAASCETSRQQQHWEANDKLAQQKRQKNLWNEQQQQKQQQQLQWNRTSNQKGRDIAQVKRTTLLTYDLNSF